MSEKRDEGMKAPRLNISTKSCRLKKADSRSRKQRKNMPGSLIEPSQKSRLLLGFFA
jgi:hypothetical protein